MNAASRCLIERRPVADLAQRQRQTAWFLVDAGLHFDLRPFDTDPDALAIHTPANPNPYFGRGWVPGKMLTAWLLRNMLKQAADAKSADVVDLSGDGSGLSDPQEATMRRIIA